MKHIVRGRVIHGEGIGRTTGYPTANLDLYYYRYHPVPKGIYVARTEINNKKYQTLVIIGVPYVKQKKRFKIELYLLNYKGNLRNRYLIAELIKKLRPIRKFNNDKELVAQIKGDIKQAKKIL